VAAVVIAAVAANIAALVIATNRKAIFRSEVWVKPASLFFSLVCVLDGLRAASNFSRPFTKGRMNQIKEQHIEVEGVVAAVLPGTMFRVALQNKHVVLATICGKMRKRWVRIVIGDRVKM
jgi:translation initiation factor IF-1